MAVKEKLVEFVHNARMNALWHNAQKPDEYITDMLMEDGVTVQENCKACAEATQNFIVKLQEQIAELRSVQEWISQAEFPWMGEEIAKLCIRYMEDYADFHGYASSKKVKAHIVRLLELEKDGRIAILPQPLKEND
jgi:hypothetical protein